LTPTCPLQHQEVPPDAKYAVKLRVTILVKKFSVKHDTWQRQTYNRLPKFHVVLFVENRIVKVVQGRLPLKREFMERVEAIKCKNSLRPINCSREPPGTQELSTVMNDTIGSTVTEIN
jgi:hypothetical protein